MNPVIKNYIKRFALLFFGLMIASYGTSMTIMSNLGISPWDVFSQGIALKLSAITGKEILIGTMTQAVGWVVLILAIALREKIGFGTIVDIVIVGNFMNFYMTNGLIPTPDSFMMRFVVLIAGFVIWSFGVYMYLAAELGAGPRDSLMSALAKRNIPVAIAKNAIEAVVFVVGWIFGGTVGIGTVIAVFIMGYLLKFWFAVFRFDLANSKNDSIIDTVKNIKNALVKN